MRYFALIIGVLMVCATMTIVVMTCEPALQAAIQAMLTALGGEWYAA